MNIAHTQYIGGHFPAGERQGSRFLPFFGAAKKIIGAAGDALRVGIMPLAAAAIVAASVIGYVAAINVIMVSGVSLKKTQNEIKILQTSVLKNESALAEARSAAFLKKQTAIAAMENIGGVRYVSSVSSFADASAAQAPR